VSDNNSWHSPGEAAPGTPPSPAYGPGIPPITPPGGAQPGPQFTPYAGAPGPQAGWTPPPKPGLIPLQPLTLGTILSGSFQVMRRNPRPTFGVSLVINGIIGLITILTVGAATYFSLDRVVNATESAVDDIAAGGVAVTLLSSLLGLGLALVGTAILQGIISLEVARGTVGEKLRFRALWALARGRIGVLIGWSVLIGAVVFVVTAVVVVAIAVLAVTLGTLGIVLAIVVGLLALAGAVALGAWLGTRLSLVPSVLLLERLTLMPALRRSWSLTTGYFWRTFGIQILVAAIVGIAAQVVTFPVSLIVSLSSGVTNPNGDLSALAGTTLLSMVVTTMVGSLVASVTAIITSASTALIYIDLRMRKEGLDLDLVRFVEARQGGDSTASDPYLPHAASRTNGTTGTDSTSSDTGTGPGTNGGPGPAASDSPWA
jgi:hypothetical protein